MYLKILLLLFASVLADLMDDPSSRQLLMFKENNTEPIGTLTTSYGSPVEYRHARSSLNSNLLTNPYFMDSLPHFSRERIPERVVHAVGSGAKGYFEVTHDITHICKAKLFSEIGKRTAVAVRFSTVVANRGEADTTRDVRGFGVKFYTEDGNFDIAGLNLPIFAIKDPLFFTSFTGTQRRNPVTNMKDANMLWDFLTLRPESLHLFMYVFSDAGIPDGYRHMPGFGVHTFEVVNKLGEKYFVKFHFIPDAGIKHLFTEKAQKIAGIDPDYGNRDLYNAIESGNYPSWTFAIQVISMEEMKNSNVDIFDITRSWPIDVHPLHPVGKLVLNENPANYFAEVEQIAISPAHLVPGINGANDKLFEARRLLYPDSQYYRLGVNFNNIKINRPRIDRAYTYNRDGRAPYDGRSGPNYFPNSFNGAESYTDDTETELTEIYQDDAPSNYDQVRDMYDNMCDDERERLIKNIVNSLGQAAEFLQEKALELFSFIHPSLGNKIRVGLQSYKPISYDDL